MIGKVLLKTWESQGSKFNIYVTPDGVFSAYEPDDETEIRGVADATTLEKLEAALKRRVQQAMKVTLDIPIVREHDDRLQDGVVYGIHTGNGNLLVRWDDGSSEQLAGYAQLFRADMPVEARVKFEEGAADMRRGQRVQRLVRDQYGVGMHSIKQKALEQARKALPDAKVSRTGALLEA